MAFDSKYHPFCLVNKKQETFFSYPLTKEEPFGFHIKENAEKKDINIDFVNCYTDHCHCLVSLSLIPTGLRVFVYNVGIKVLIKL